MSNIQQFVHQKSRVLSQDEMGLFLKGYSHGRLGMRLEDKSYVIPVAYGYDQGRIYFH